MKTNAWTMLFLQRREGAAKVIACRKGTYNSTVWAWK